MASELYVETLKGLTSGANANKVIIPSGQTLEIDAWSPPAGTVLQTVSGLIETSQQTNTSTTYANLGYGISITPTSVNNKFLVMLHVEAMMTGGANQDNEIMFRIVRDVGGTITEIQENTHRGYDYGGSGVYVQGSGNWIVLDSPSTANQLTYRLQGRSVKNSAPAQILGEVSSGNMWIVQEIAG